MSVYDDPINASKVVMYGDQWIPFESASAMITIAPIFRLFRVNFLGCGACEGLLDPWDVAHDDFGDLRCAWCGAKEIFPVF